MLDRQPHNLDLMPLVWVSFKEGIELDHSRNKKNQRLQGQSKKKLESNLRFPRLGVLDRLGDVGKKERRIESFLEDSRASLKGLLERPKGMKVTTCWVSISTQRIGSFPSRIYWNSQSSYPTLDLLILRLSLLSYKEEDRSGPIGLVFTESYYFHSLCPTKSILVDKPSIPGYK